MLAAFAPGAAAAPPAAARQGALKVCIVGNSHMAALRLAMMQGLFGDPDMDIVFWGFPKDNFRRIRLRDGKLIAPDAKFALMVSGGRYESIDPREFNVLVFVGGGFNTTATLRWVKERIDAGGIASDADLRRRLRSRLAESPAMRLMRSLPRASGRTVVFVPTPLVSEGSADKPRQDIDPSVLERMNRALADLLGELGVVYLAQPAETIQDNKSTRNEYWEGGIGAIRPDSSEFKGRGFKHMNPRYGAVILARLRERLLQPA
jgi:hypothetical protein